MKFILIIFICIITTSLLAKEDVDLGSIDGRIRIYNIFKPAYIKSGREKDNILNGSTIGGRLGYNTPIYSGFSATTAVYYAAGTGLNNIDDVDTVMAAGRFFTADYSSKAVIGELNIQYKDNLHYVITGHFKLDTPLTNSVYTYMPNMFEAYLYENSFLESTSITIAQIEKMAYGTRAPVEFGLIGEATRTAGTTQSGINTRGDFIEVEKQILADNSAKTNGITVLGIENKSIVNTKISIWDFYAYDIINMFYIDGTYKDQIKNVSYSVSAQYLRVDSIGKDLALKWLDSKSAYLMGIKTTLKYKKAFFYLAYNHSGNSKLLNPWSGDPAYTSSFFSKNAYRANVDAYKVGFHFNILKNLKLITDYANYGKSTTLGSFVTIKPVEPLSKPQRDAFETTVLLSYTPFNNFNILGGIIYKKSEYFYEGKQVELLDVDLAITYNF